MFIGSLLIYIYIYVSVTLLLYIYCVCPPYLEYVAPAMNFFTFLWIILSPLCTDARRIKQCHHHSPLSAPPCTFSLLLNTFKNAYRVQALYSTEVSSQNFRYIERYFHISTLTEDLLSVANYSDVMLLYDTLSPDTALTREAPYRLHSEQSTTLYMNTFSQALPLSHTHT